MLKDYPAKAHEKKVVKFSMVIQSPKKKLFRAIEIPQKGKQFVPLDSKKAWIAFLKLFNK